LAPVPVSTARVPLPVIVPPVRPLPAVTEVTVPELVVSVSVSAAGAQAEPFHLSTCPTDATASATGAPRKAEALTLVSAAPSTAGSGLGTLPVPGTDRTVSCPLTSKPSVAPSTGTLAATAA
jgi:hypothetical protein